MRLAGITTATAPDESGAPHHPWWLADVDPEASCSPYVGDQRADVAIVGGGFTGLWTALALKQRAPKTDVVLLEAATCGWAASGRNGGAVHGYWSSWPKLPLLVGERRAVEIASLGTVAQDAIREFCVASPVETEFAEEGFAMVATSTAQEAAIDGVLDAAPAMPESQRPRVLEADELWRMTRNPTTARGILFPEGGTVQPARLVRALKHACLEAGVRIHETTTVDSIDSETTTLYTSGGRLRARDIVLATNAWMSSLGPIAKHTTNLSSHVVVTEPMPEIAAKLDLPHGLMIRDGRMFLHWVRRTRDDRFVVGTGAGPLSYGGRVTGPQFRDRRSTDRVINALSTFIPEAAQARFEASWGGAIDLSSDNCPYFATLSGTRIHYGTGYSGHGVNAAWIGGQSLASLALGTSDRWTKSAFCVRDRPRLPPEPARYLGGAAVRRHTIALEDALDEERTPSAPTRAVAALPRLLGIRVGTR